VHAVRARCTRQHSFRSFVYLEGSNCLSLNIKDRSFVLLLPSTSSEPSFPNTFTAPPYDPPSQVRPPINFCLAQANMSEVEGGAVPTQSKGSWSSFLKVS
jgi:hypothetical protein